MHLKLSVCGYALGLLLCVNHTSAFYETRAVSQSAPYVYKMLRWLQNWAALLELHMHLIKSGSYDIHHTSKLENLLQSLDVVFIIYHTKSLTFLLSS